MTFLVLLMRQVRAENRAFWRNPASAFFTFAFPLLFMVILNLVFASSGGADGSALAFYTPAIIAFSMVNAGFTTLAMSISIARDDGILKRVHGTPLPTWTYLLARTVHSVAMGLLLSAIVGSVGAAAFGVPMPLGQLPLVVLVLIIGGFAFGALGLAVAGLVPNASAAPAVVNAIALPLLFISNTFIRIEGGVLVTISDLFPVRPFADSLQALWSSGSSGAFDPRDMAFVAAWGVVGLLVARRTFTWEPRV